MECLGEPQNGRLITLGQPPVFAFSGLNVYGCHKKSYFLGSSITPLY
jgi:hypothetical protein